MNKQATPAREIPVFRGLVNVYVTKPEGMGDEQFDDALDKRYADIVLAVQAHQRLMAQSLSKVGGPLAGYAVKVEIV